jgi:hypothetical protein
MIAEAELSLQADQAAMAVFSAIRDDQWELMLPPVFDMPGADRPARCEPRSTTTPTTTPGYRT